MTATPKDLKGRKVGRYDLVEHLASGGMAEIFLARHRGEAGFAKELVLKILQGRYAEHPEVVRMFLDEARLAAKLNHPNVVDVYDVGLDDGLRYIAMEHIRGKTLTEVVRRAIEVSRPLPLDQAAYLVGETAAGLAYMHDGNDGRGRPFRIVHRDISPSNLILSLSGQVKIIDFGIAREADGGEGAGEEESGARPGKFSYMSPEQVRGGPLDGRSDIFSLGTILYEITLGKRLWRGPKELVMRRIVEEKAPPPTYVNRSYPPALELVVQKALEKRPEDRYQSAGDLFHDLEQFLVAAGARTRNHQVAQYLHELFAPTAAISEMGVRRAQAFEDDDQAEDPNQLDLDRPAAGAGRALADALRASGPYVPTTVTREAPVGGSSRPTLPVVASATSGTVPAGPMPLVQRSVSAAGPPIGIGESALPPLVVPPGAGGALLEPLPSSPRRLRMGLLFGLVIASAAAVGLLLALARI
jgi:tRNA A-37 threonylcarbamoyl transferase component Bud32